MIKEHIARNKEIAIAVLSGETYKSVGKRYDLSSDRCRQITATVCRRVARHLYAKASENRESADIRILRKSAETLIEKIKACTFDKFIKPVRKYIVKWRIARTYYGETIVGGMTKAEAGGKVLDISKNLEAHVNWISHDETKTKFIIDEIEWNY